MPLKMEEIERELYVTINLVLVDLYPPDSVFISPHCGSLYNIVRDFP